MAVLDGPADRHQAGCPSSLDVGELQITLVVMVAIGAVLVFQRSFAAVGPTYAGVAVVTLAYWVRYAMVRRS